MITKGLFPCSIGFALITTLGCGSSMDAEGGEAVGQIGISLTSVPSDGTCIRFTTTAGSRSFQQSFDAVADSPLTAALHGLPYNQTLSIFAEAFAGSCSAVTSSSLATYLSDAQSTILAPGETKSIAFTLRPTGNINGTADFLFLTMTPTSKAYGNVVVGQQSAFTFSIANIGMIPTSPLTASIVDTFAPAGNFTISSNTCTGPLPAGEKCTVEVKLAPTLVGLLGATLQVSAMTGGTVTASLTGTGFGPAHLAFSPVFNPPGPVNLGNVPIGSSFRFADFYVTNTGDETTGQLTTTLDPNNTEYFLAASCTGTLAGHGSCRTSVRFTPASLGTKTATLTVTGMPGGTATLLITGTGVTPLTFTPASADFGSAPVGTTGTTQTFTIKNTGTATSTALSVSSATPDFTITADTCSTKTLAASATCTVNVQLSPTVAGPVSGSLNVNAQPGWSAQAALTGAGT
jgi:hypothetical protein